MMSVPKTYDIYDLMATFSTDAYIFACPEIRY